MAKKTALAILVYGKADSGRDALREEKYRDLAAAFLSQQYDVRSVLYTDERVLELAETLPAFNAILVWVNPIEQGNNRKKLDSLLTELAAKGCLVSAHPDTILKMGTKDVLFKTKHMDWGGDTEMYIDFEHFTKAFPEKLKVKKIRVLKQYRGNGGNGVFKIQLHEDNRVNITHATSGNEVRTLAWSEFLDEFKHFFAEQGLLIDQEWNHNTINGMVRCYVCGTKVAGFGYQEINALYELNDAANDKYIPPGKRYYFTENCGLFSDLKEIMESKWIPELQGQLDLPDSMMPVIWDADFFINSINSPTATGKFNLCEINASCVSPFPPSAIGFIVTEVGKRIGNQGVY